MGFGGSGIGFIAGGGSGGGSASVVSIVQYVVGAAGGPTDQTTLFQPNPTIDGINMAMSVSGGFGFLQEGVQFTFTTVANKITTITLLTGLRFNAGELYTIIGYVS